MNIDVISGKQKKINQRVLSLSKLFLKQITDLQFVTAAGNLFHRDTTLCEKKFERSSSLLGRLMRPYDGAAMFLVTTVEILVAWLW